MMSKLHPEAGVGLSWKEGEWRAAGVDRWIDLERRRDRFVPWLVSGEFERCGHSLRSTLPDVNCLCRLLSLVAVILARNEERESAREKDM